MSMRTPELRLMCSHLHDVVDVVRHQVHHPSRLRLLTRSEEAPRQLYQQP